MSAIDLERGFDNALSGFSGGMNPMDLKGGIHIALRGSRGSRGDCWRSVFSWTQAVVYGMNPMDLKRGIYNVLRGFKDLEEGPQIAAISANV